MHYLYILYSNKLDKYYIGQSKQVENRLVKHNKGHSLATKGGIPWGLVKMIEFESKSHAIQAENWLKRMKSSRIIKQFIDDEIDLKRVIEK